MGKAMRWIRSVLGMKKEAKQPRQSLPLIQDDRHELRSGSDVSVSTLKLQLSQARFVCVYRIFSYFFSFDAEIDTYICLLVKLELQDLFFCFAFVQ